METLSFFTTLLALASAFSFEPKQDPRMVWTTKFGDRISIPGNAPNGYLKIEFPEQFSHFHPEEKSRSLTATIGDYTTAPNFRSERSHFKDNNGVPKLQIESPPQGRNSNAKISESTDLKRLADVIRGIPTKLEVPILSQSPNKNALPSTSANVIGISPISNFRSTQPKISADSLNPLKSITVNQVSNLDKHLTSKNPVSTPQTIIKATFAEPSTNPHNKRSHSERSKSLSAVLKATDVSTSINQYPLNIQPGINIQYMSPPKYFKYPTEFSFDNFESAKDLAFSGELFSPPRFFNVRPNELQPKDTFERFTDKANIHTNIDGHNPDTKELNRKVEYSADITPTIVKVKQHVHNNSGVASISNENTNIFSLTDTVKDAGTEEAITSRDSYSQTLTNYRVIKPERIIPVNPNVAQQNPAAQTITTNAIIPGAIVGHNEPLLVLRPTTSSKIHETRLPEDSQQNSRKTEIVSLGDVMQGKATKEIRNKLKSYLTTLAKYRNIQAKTGSVALNKKENREQLNKNALPGKTQVPAPDAHSQIPSSLSGKLPSLLSKFPGKLSVSSFHTFIDEDADEETLDNLKLTPNDPSPDYPGQVSLNSLLKYSNDRNLREKIKNNIISGHESSDVAKPSESKNQAQDNKNVESNFGLPAAAYESSVERTEFLDWTPLVAGPPKYPALENESKKSNDATYSPHEKVLETPRNTSQRQHRMILQNKDNRVDKYTGNDSPSRHHREGHTDQAPQTPGTTPAQYWPIEPTSDQRSTKVLGSSVQHHLPHDKFWKIVSTHMRDSSREIDGRKQSKGPTKEKKSFKVTNATLLNSFSLPFIIRRNEGHYGSTSEISP